MELSSKDILRLYIENDKNAVYKYNHLCALLLSFDQWSAKSKEEFILQFAETYGIVGPECNKFVEAICGIEWRLISSSKSRKLFVEYLTKVAICQVYHIKNVFQTLFLHLRPDSVLSPLPDSGIDCPPEEKEKNEHIQFEIYNLAIIAIGTIFNSTPSCKHLLIAAAKFKFPHIKANGHLFVNYLKNMMIVADRCPSSAQELWVIVIEKLLQMDAIISHSIRNMANKYNSDEISLFATEEDDMRTDEPTKELEVDLTDKLDRCMTLILARISKNRTKIKGECTQEAVKWVRSNDFDDDLDHLFEHFWPAFVQATLQAHDVQSVPFIWFYFCSFEEKYLNFMLRTLWNLVAMPSFAPNEWKKSQNAANFLGAFIARSNYVSFDKAFSWMKQMADWCNEYINAAGLRKNVEGCLQHGTFYSVVQALLFVFSFRYKEFVDNDCVKEVIQNWGLQRIIHSQFQPLRFISRIIALGFTTISRQLQIVYCFHILDDEPGKSPIEHYLPYSILQLPISSSILVPLIRKFQPADDDVDKISIDFNEDVKKRQDSSGDGDYDFMDDDEMAIDGQNNVKNILSTSPMSSFAT